METENEGLPRGVRFPVDFMCRMLGVSRAGYYAWRNRGPSAHAVFDAELTEKIREVDEEQKHRCGIELILWELQEDGLRTSQRRVRRLARAAGVECVHPRPYVRTTLPDAQAREGLADLVDRDFRPASADQLWVGDITYSAQLAVMCSPAWGSACCLAIPGRVAAHNQRPSRNARSRSLGWNRAGAGPGSPSRRSTASLAARSASRY
jgi:hypothetical protein